MVGIVVIVTTDSFSEAMFDACALTSTFSSGTASSFPIQIYAFPSHFLTAARGTLIKLKAASITPDATYRTG